MRAPLRLGTTLVLAVLAALVATASARSQQREQEDREGKESKFYPRMLFDQRARMRDGVELSADVYLPREPGRYPVILIRTPYDKTQNESLRDGRYFASKGYAVVIQDVRGRGNSQGTFDPFFQEDVDGYDTVEWAAREPWSNGSIGMMGGSYLGFVQWAAAKLRPPHLKVLASTAAVGRTFREYWYNYGAINLYPLHWFFRLTGHTTPNPDIVDWKEVFKHLPLSTMDEAMGFRSPIWKEYLEHSTFDAYWKRMDLTGHFRNIDLPALHITGWFDGDQAGQMFFYEGMAADSPAKHRQWLLIGPWDHAGTRKPALELGGLEFGKDAIVDMHELHRQWFDYWLRDRKDTTFEKQPKVKYFLTGENRWYEAGTWPPPLAERESWYLHSNGMANTMAGDGALDRTRPALEQPDRYVYNPEFPVPTTPDKGVSYVTSDTFDQRYVERRDDVLCYTSEALEQPLAIGGRVTLVFYAGSDAPDTDFMAKLIDVHPDERALMLGPMVGVIRARFRDSLSNPTLLTPGTVYRYEIDLNHVGHTFLRGHRIRVELTSSNFPMHDRNPNTGAPIGKTTEMRLARQTIYHDADHPSALILPVLRGDAPQTVKR